LGDTKEVYRYYATSVLGVAAAQLVRTPRGPGSTDVIVAAVNGVPSQALHDHELLGFDVQVKAPNVVPITIQIEYSGDVAVGDIRLIAETYMYGLGIGGRFAVRELYGRYESLALMTVEIVSPVRDVQADTTSIIPPP
jgi:hypothetical protein